MGLDCVHHDLSDFQKSHQQTGKYQGGVGVNYNYDWEKMFRIMGIKYR